MKINGNLTFNADGSGVIQNAFIEEYAGGSDGGSLPTSVKGRIIYNSDNNYYYYYNGSEWVSFAAGTTSVASFQTSLAGLMPSSATTGAITLSGTLGATSGGTGSTTAPTSGQFLYSGGGTSYAPTSLSSVAVTSFSAGSTGLTSSTSTGVITLGGTLNPASGGTGINNGSYTITLGGNVSTSSALTTTGTGGITLNTSSGSSVTVPASGTLLTTGDMSNYVASIADTANEITASASTGAVTLSIPNTFVAPGSIASATTMASGTTMTVGTNLTVGGLTYESAAIIAAASGGQGSATVIVDSYDVVTSGTGGVQLPVAGPGLEISIVNTTGSSIDVYPNGTDTIDGAGASIPVVLPAGGTATYQSVHAGQWYTIDPVAVTSGTGLSVTYGNGQTTFANTGVTSITFGSTGLTPSSTSTGDVSVAGTLVVGNGGTGAATFTSNGVLYGNGTSAIQATAAGTTGQVLGNVSGVPTWQAPSAGFVTSFETSLSGLTPDSSTTGAVTLAGTLGVASGGTGDITLTLNGMLYGNGTGAVGVTSAGTQYNVFQVGSGGVPTVGSIDISQSATVGSSILGLANGGTNADLTPVAGAPVYSTSSALALGTAGSAGQAYISGGSGAPTWQDVSSNINADPGAILEGDGSGNFTASGGTFIGSGIFSGVALQGTVTGSTDATTKAYVDAAVSNLNIHASALLFADSTNTTILSGSVYANGTPDENGGTGIGATLTDTTSGTVLVVDGVTVPLNARVVVNTFANTDYPPNPPSPGPSTGLYNGIYTLTTVGVASTTPWVLTRAVDYNDSIENQVIAGDFVFISEGTNYKNTGWTQTDVGSASIGTVGAIKIGTDNIYFTQFSGAGTYLAGTGLSLSGNTFNANVDGVTIYFNVSNQIAVDSSNTAGQVLLSSGTAGTTATWGAVTLSNTNAVTGTLPVGNGGTGDTTLTSNGVLYGNDTGAIQATTVGASGTVLTGTGGAPSFATLSDIAVTSFETTLSGLTPSSTTSGAVTLAGTLGVASGGTGAMSFTAHGVLIGEGTSAVTSTAVGATGTVLTGVTGSDPTFQTLSDITVTSITGTANQIDTTASTGDITLSLDSALIAPGSVTITTFLYESTDPSITATGTTQDTAYQLTKQYNDVTTVSGSNNGVILPTAAAGLEITVVNFGNTQLMVYPATGGNIDNAGTNKPIMVPSGGTWTGEAANTTQWYSVDPVVISGNGGISVAYGNGATSINNTGVLSLSTGTTGLSVNSASGNVVLSGILNPASGGTGVANDNASTITISGSYPLTLTLTGSTSVTVPTSGTLLSTANATGNYVSSVSTTVSGLSFSPTTGAAVLSGTLTSTSGGTGVDNSAGAVGTALVATSTGNFTATPIQYVETFATPAEYFAVAHNLNQQFVTVQVYTTDTLYAITGGDAGSGGDFQVATDVTSVFTAGTYFIVNGSGADDNDGAYTVVSSSYSAGNTTIVVTGSVPNTPAHGNVVVGPAQIIPQGIFLVDANDVVVTLNASLAVTIVVMGVAGVVDNS